jgi:hypothetical protein
MKERKQVEPSKEYAGFYPVVAPLVMCRGVGDGKTTACVMAQAATIDALRKGLTLDKPTDQMECACPLLRRMAIFANDTDWWKNDAERTEYLRPLIPLLLDSRASEAVTWKRIYAATDNVVRTLTPMRLEFIGRKEDVKNIATLRNLPLITNKESAKAAGELCSKMRASESADVYASAHADAYADVYASAHADAYADVYADVYAYASADVSASAYAYASASASAYAHGSASAYAQNLKYRTAHLDLFRKVAAITE